MIFSHSRNGKITSGFSLIEIVISIIILSFIGIGVFQMYRVVAEQKEILEETLTANYFGKYVVSVVRKSDIPESLNKIGTPFYLFEKENEEIDFSNDPDLYDNSVGFQGNTSRGMRVFRHEISFLGGVVLKGVSYNNYKIKTTYNGNENTFYITK